LPRHRLCVAPLALHLLVAATLWLGASSQAQTLTATRTSAFEYAPSGLLTAEIVEPDNPALCVRTTYTHDAHGNRTSATTAPCAGGTSFAPRTTTQSFGSVAVTVRGVPITVPEGTFASQTANALGHTETLRHDPRFGTPLEQIGPNGLATRWEYDGFGRKTQEIRADGTRTLSLECFIPARVSDASSNDRRCPAPAHAPSLAVSFTHVQQVDAAGNGVGPYQRKYFDALGRAIREEHQAFDGTTQPAAARVVLRDTLYNQPARPSWPSATTKARCSSA